MPNYNKDIAHEYIGHMDDKNNIDDENLNDFIDDYICDLIGYNSDKKNIKIIMKHFGSIYKALKSYKDEHDKYPDDDEGEEYFHYYLAEHTIREIIDIDLIKEYITEEDSTDEDSTDDI